MPPSSLSPTQSFPIAELDFFSSFDQRFSAGDPKLSPFLGLPAEKSSFRLSAKEKLDHYAYRIKLAELLKKQYSGVTMTPKLQANIDGLSGGQALSVTTAHQPILFGGPLYFLYKALTAISLAKEASGWLDGHQVVPVYVLGTEDHDYEEVRHVRFFSEQLTWESGREGGPVGRMPLGNISALIEQAEELFKPLPYGAEVIDLLRSSYAEGQTFGQSTFYFLHKLLGHHGLVILDLDSPIAKSTCISIFESELLESIAKPIVHQTLDALEVAGFKQQAHVRDINLFYLDQQRDRIERFDDSGYRTVRGSRMWSTDALIKELHQYPERFSPNVILRPLLQESILPNIAFVGGGGELAYWVQLRDLFTHFRLPYPILVRRHSALLLDEGTQQKLTKLRLPIETTFQPLETVLQQFVHDRSEMSSDLEVERKAVHELMKTVLAKCAEIEPTLERSAEAAETQIDKLLQNLEGKMTRGLKHVHDQEITQIKGVFDRVLPNGSLQERTENCLPWIARYGHTWIDDLLESFQPLDKSFVCYSF